MAHITIKDVAKSANVSPATVSRVINGASNVDPNLKNKVLSVIEKLNFTPNQLARGLRNDTTNTIGVVVSDISNPFFINVAREIEKIINRYGYMMLMVSTDSSAEKELQYVSIMEQKHVDGLIISPDISTKDHLETIRKVRCPVVCIDRKTLNQVYDSVYVDKASSMYDVTEYLIKKGHTKIALLTGPEELTSNFDRYMGYVKAYHDNGLPFNHDYVMYGRFDEEFGRQSLKKLMKMKERPTAIVSGSINITNGILVEAQDRGIHIPQDISLISFGQISMQQIIEPKVTYVESLITEIGRTAGDMIIARIRHPELPINEKIITAKIIEGNSVKNLLG